MSHSKKYQSSWRCSIYDICLGFFTICFPVILFKSFFCALAYIFLLSTISSLNAISITKRSSPFSFATSMNSFEDFRNERTFSKKTERKEFSLLKGFIISMSTVVTYYVLCVFFGAPVFELYTSTLYFSSLMTVLTVYPLLWYFYSSDSLASVIRVFSDIKSDNYTESHFHSFFLCTVLGAWIGAFPIPLDWDRHWQVWPIPCCIGASLGYAAAHFFMGGKLLYVLVKEKRKLTSSRSV